MANRHKVQALARGGKADHSKGVHHAAVDYGNEDVIKEAKNTADGEGVKAVMKKDGGSVPGKTSAPRMDKRASGGKVTKKFARGGSPFSAASKVKG